ncbi:hypothetical protein ACLB2K_046048 [Fragaria x ananassa]
MSFREVLWNYLKMSIILEECDGKNPTSIPMNKLYFWVGILNIPKALEKDRYIRNVSTIIGTYIYKDDRLFVATQQIRVRVSHALNRPFYEKKKTLKIMDGVVKEFVFQFENMIGVCKHCDLIQHEHGVCLKVGGGNPNPSSSKVVFPASFRANSIVFTDASFLFKGSENESTPSVVCGLFDPKLTIRKLTIIRRETILEEANPASQAVVTIDTGKKVVETLKRGRPSSPTASPN